MFGRKRLRVTLRRVALLALTALAISALAIQPALAALTENDEMETAKEVTGPEYKNTQDVTTATSNPEDPDCYGSEKSVWYKLTTVEDVIVVANTFGSNYNTTLSAWTGERGSLEQLACNDDHRGWRPLSQIEIEIPADETVYFMVAKCCGFSPSAGESLQFNAYIQPPVDIDLTVTPTGLADVAAGDAVVRGTVTCSRPVRLALSGEVRQNEGDLARGYFSRKIDCGPDPFLWTGRAESVGKSGFAGGLARVEAQAAVMNEIRQETAQVDKTVHLTGCTIIGTPGNNYIEGSPRDDVICGLAGDDRIVSKGGNDRIIGGPGHDNVHAGAGNDILAGGPGLGSNKLDGGAGRDECRIETRRDALTGCERVTGP